jgi:hypothetical protein
MEAVGSLVTSTLFLYWYTNFNKNFNGISFSISQFQKGHVFALFCHSGTINVACLFIWPWMYKHLEWFVISQLSALESFTDVLKFADDPGGRQYTRKVYKTINQNGKWQSKDLTQCHTPRANSSQGVCKKTTWRCSRRYKSYACSSSGVLTSTSFFSFYLVLCFVDRVSRNMRVMNPTWCTIYLHFIESLHLYRFRAS